ncbi:MAG: glycosyltransferase family 39 protein [Candidatus Aenigmarchaeota archaeon]|nr:glycosyltransferase family 39 protein [Candidatus Aenigmarchaeota archaeon]
MEMRENHFWYGVLVFVLLTSLIINLNLTLTTPTVFGDEGFYMSRGEWISQHLTIPKYYYIHIPSPKAYRPYFLRPPFYMFLLASIFPIGGELLVKTLNPIISMLVCLVAFFIGKRLYSVRVGVLGAFSLALIPSFITYSTLFYPEVFGTLLSLSSILFTYRGIRENRKLLILLGGTMAGLGGITEVGSLALPVLFFFIFLLYKRNWLKNFTLSLIAFLIMLTPVYGIHNYLMFGNPGLPIINRYFPSYDLLQKLPNYSVGKIVSPVEMGIGTGATIFNMGLLNYIQFAYGLVTFIFFSIGFSYLLLKRNKKNITVLLWLLVWGFILFYVTRSGRAEDAARNMIYTTVPFGLMSGIGIERTYKFLKGYGKDAGKVIALLFIFIIVIFGIFSIHTKAESLRPVKQFSSAFFKGCDWIRRNTPEDSLMLTLWQHRAEYACKRDTIYVSEPGGKDMVFLGNDTSYKIMKKMGVNYIYIQKFSIRPGKESESYPWIFVKYIRSSDHFKKVYEYPDNCMNTNEQDCVIVYKVL